MGFDKDTRKRLSHFVANARTLLKEDIEYQLKAIYGIGLDGTIQSTDTLTALDEPGLQLAHTLRERISYLARTHTTEKTPEACSQKAIEQLAREQAFTVLNRLAAIRMAEKRNIVQESVAKGYQSRGFKVFGSLAGSSLGEIYSRYLQYIHCLFNELAVDLGALFDLKSPQGLLFPRENCLISILALFNSPDLEFLWAEDETVGWIYQYYNDPAERKEMRKSSAPRNSRELAVRNQFFTPRYVVDFLTDNTLGRIWYEMCQGQTNLKDRCRYLVRRPNEIFLKEDEAAPEQPNQENLSQEELLKQTVYIPYRQLKDPRTILMLDPACGSMHFGLYAFDLFEEIYHEAWDREEQNKGALLRPKGMKSLHQIYANKTLLLVDIPRLIIEHNIHGVDIDPRATQIAALSLWLRAHRTWNDQKTPLADRPRITKSNIVCAEPMPGDLALLQEFVKDSFSVNDQPLFQHLLEQIFEKMQLAGEAGSLLKIEEEITSAVEGAKAAWAKSSPASKGLFGTAEMNAAKKPGSQAELPGMDTALSALDVTTDFWERIEERIYATLRNYAEQAETGGGFQRRLFAEDAARGFAFIDICRKRYDVALMNPPFGESSIHAEEYLHSSYPYWAGNVLCAFLGRMKTMLSHGGRIGAIFDRTAAIKSSYEQARAECLIGQIATVADTGWNVLDANVETTCVVLAPHEHICGDFYDIRSFDPDAKASVLLKSIGDATLSSSCYSVILDSRRFSQLPNQVIGYDFDAFALKAFQRFPLLRDSGYQARQGHALVSNVHFRVFWEVDAEGFHPSGHAWVYNGSEFTLFVAPHRDIVIDGRNSKWLSSHRSVVLRNPTYQFLPGIGYGKRGEILDAHILPPQHLFTSEGQALHGVNIRDGELRLAFLNSKLAHYLINLFCGQHKHCGYINLLPDISVGLTHTNAISRDVKHIVMLKSKWLSHEETSIEFLTSLAADIKGARLGDSIGKVCDECFFDQRTYEQLTQRLDAEFFAAAGLVEKEVLKIDLWWTDLCKGDMVWPCLAKGDTGRLTDAWVANCFVSQCAGCAFGRWDIRYATGEQAAPELPDPFAPLPVCPPGQLQNAQGLPARPEDVPASYPLKNIPWDGILVDDPNHPRDIEHRIREVIEIIWSGKEGGPSAEAIEHEACEILSVNLIVKSLRDYFRKPAGFFADHLRRYSKSRRQAPIYWPLSTKSGSYTLWIYYHRLTDQTLHTCLADFVNEKIKDNDSEIGNLRESKITGERLEDLLEFKQELSDFQAELEEIIKLPWKPNLNDGVLINAAPLWKLFRLPAWQQRLKTTWEELKKGDYDWAHLAYTIWPERVKDACKSDRSMAIAHGLEHLCTIQAPKAKAKRKVKASSEDEAELDLFSNAPEIEEAEDSITIPPKGKKNIAKKPIAGEKVTRPRGRPAKTPKSDNPLGDK